MMGPLAWGGPLLTEAQRSCLSGKRSKAAIEMVGSDKTRPIITRALALVLAAVFLVFFVQVASHSHEKGKSEATCQVCQAARVGSYPPSGASSAQIHLQQVAYVEPFALAFHQEFFFQDCPSRAPPSISL